MKYSYLTDYQPAIPVVEIEFGFPEGALTVGPLTAIIDTGADGSLVPQSIIDQINAPLVDQVRARSHWGEWRIFQVYTLDIRIENLILPAVEVAGDSGQEVLLGRNVLNHLRLLLDGPGKQTTLL